MIPATSRAFARRTLLASSSSALAPSSVSAVSSSSSAVARSAVIGGSGFLHTSAARATGENRIPANVGKEEPREIVTEDPAQEELRVEQAPNRRGVWSRSQQPRARAMAGPRFEQTDMEAQLIHRQPVRWTDKHVVACDGGGGPLGHPRIFINVDKPQVCHCTYCGLPFANTHHRKHLESLPSTPYPLDPPSGDPAVVEEPMKVTDEPLAQR